MSPSAKLLVALVALTAVAGVLAFTRPTSAADQRELTPAAAYWMKRARAAEQRAATAATDAELARSQARDARRRLAAAPSSVEAIRLAAVTYRVPFDLLWHRAACESGPGPNAPVPAVEDRHVNPSARNPVAETRSGEHAVGLFAFLPSTWRTTPYRDFSITSPYANAAAAAWMQANGRGGEWAIACR